MLVLASVAGLATPGLTPWLRIALIAGGILAGVGLLVMLSYLQGEVRTSARLRTEAQIAQREANIDDLEREKRRWHDPAYVQAQARERFGYLMPGETSYVVLGEDGKPLESRTSLTDPSTVNERTPTAWWTNEWKSIELAGVPPKPQPPPASRIDGSKQ